MDRYVATGKVYIIGSKDSFVYLFEQGKVEHQHAYVTK